MDELVGTASIDPSGVLNPICVCSGIKRASEMDAKTEEE
jgi:hypothetical protein